MNIRSQKIFWKSFILSSLFIINTGCSILDEPLTKALTSSADVRLEKIDRTKAIIKYDSGALIEANGEDEAKKEMSRHCSPQNYNVLESSERVTGEKKWTHTIIFECVDSK